MGQNDDISKYLEEARKILEKDFKKSIDKQLFNFVDVEPLDIKPLTPLSYSFATNYVSLMSAAFSIAGGGGGGGGYASSWTSFASGTTYQTVDISKTPKKDDKSKFETWLKNATADKV